MAAETLESNAALAADAPEPTVAAGAVVRAEQIRKSFGNNVVLDGIDLTVGAGELEECAQRARPRSHGR